MQPHHHAGIVLFGVHHFFVVRVAQHRQHAALHPKTRLDHIRDVVFAGFLIEIGQILAGGVLVLGQVVIGAIRHTPQLTPAEREQELEVGGRFGIEAQLLGIVVTQTQILVFQTDAQQELVAEIAPVLEPFQIGAGFAEKFQLELAHTEDEVAGRDLVAEGFANLTDAERQLAPGGALHIHKVGKDALRGFGTQIHRVFRILGDTLEGFEHQVKLPDVGKVVLAAGGAGDLVLVDKGFHFLLRERVDGLVQRKAVFGAPIFDQLVRAEPLVALAAIHQRIRKARQVTAGDPGLRVHQNGGIQPHIVGVFLHEFFPPRALDVVFQFHAQRAVVPCVGESAVNFRSRKHKATAFAKRDDLVHRFVRVVHVDPPTKLFRRFSVIRKPNIVNPSNCYRFHKTI